MTKYLIIVLTLIFSCGLYGNELIETSPCEIKEFELGGDWQFYWNEFAELESSSDETIQLPEFWQGKIINGTEIGAQGYCTLRKKIDINECLDQPALYIEHIHSAYEVHINGKLIYRSGVIGKSKADYVPLRKPALIELPKSESIDLMIYAANFDHYRGGILRMPLLVEYDDYDHKLETGRYIDTFIAGGTGIVGFTFLFIFLFSKRTPEVICFALLSMTLCVRLMMAGIYPLHFLIDTLGYYRVMIRIEYLALFCLSVFTSLYMYFLFKEVNAKKYLLAIAGIGGLFMILSLIAPIKLFTSVTPYYLIMLLIMIALIVAIIYKGIKVGNRSALILGVAMFIGLLWAVMDTMVYFGFMESNRLFYSAIFICFVFINNLALMDKFSYEISLSKEQEAIIKAAESKKLLVSMISHEIKTPVSQLQMNFEILKSTIEFDTKFDYVRERLLPRFDSAISSIKSMLNDFIYFMNINENKPEEVSKISMLSHLKKKFEIEIEDGVPQEFKFKTNMKVFLYALGTFISNAHKYTPEGKPKPILVLNNTENVYFLSVKDFGVGIEEEKLNKMGELQVDTSDAIEVHGIGFYLAQKLLEALGHDIIINSVRNVGTTVSIKLR